MSAYEALTVAGLIIGPLSAVIVTLWYEARRSRHEKQSQIMRMLLGTRHLPADPAYTASVNLVPIEFNKQPKIMAAWQKYIELTSYTPTGENAERHHKDMTAQQTRLIFEIMKFLGYKLSETDIQTSAYAAQGFTSRETLNVHAQLAWIRIANALERQNVAAGLPEAPSAESLISEMPTHPPAGSPE